MRTCDSCKRSACTALAESGVPVTWPLAVLPYSTPVAPHFLWLTSRPDHCRKRVILSACLCRSMMLPVIAARSSA